MHTLYELEKSFVGGTCWGILRSSRDPNAVRVILHVAIRPCTVQYSCLAHVVGGILCNLLLPPVSWIRIEAIRSQLIRAGWRHKGPSQVSKSPRTSLAGAAGGTHPTAPQLAPCYILALCYTSILVRWSLLKLLAARQLLLIMEMHIMSLWFINFNGTRGAANASARGYAGQSHGIQVHVSAGYYLVLAAVFLARVRVARRTSRRWLAF